MTLPDSGPISLSNVLVELRIANAGRTEPISLGDADVLALAGKSAPPISLSDLYGKSSYVPMTVKFTNSIIGNYDSSRSGGTAAASPSVTVSGGSGGYTYAWSILSQSILVVLSNANSPACLVTRSFVRGANGEFDVFLRCIVTDSSGRSVTVDNIEAFASWGSGA